MLQRYRSLLDTCTTAQDFDQLKSLREDNDMFKIGIVFSCFDLLHAGHCLMLEDARRCCDILVVGLQSDPTIDRPEKNKPIQSFEERFIQISSQRTVHKIIKYDTEADLLLILEHLKPDVRVLGDDYIDKPFTGKGWPGVQEVYHKRSDHTYSTTNLRQRVFEAEMRKKESLSNKVKINLFGEGHCERREVMNLSNMCYSSDNEAEKNDSLSNEKVKIKLFGEKICEWRKARGLRNLCYSSDIEAEKKDEKNFNDEVTYFT